VQTMVRYTPCLDNPTIVDSRRDLNVEVVCPFIIGS
jgi:hypothetical protein